MNEFQLERIFNYRRISEKIATAGQPNEEQFIAISESGFEIVINLGLENREYSLPDEKALYLRCERYGNQMKFRKKQTYRIHLSQGCP